jgi:DNA-binding CsgD family transcriptional regulator
VIAAIRRPTYLSSVPRLSGSDYEEVLDLLWLAQDIEGSDPFPEPVLAALRALVPALTVSYHVWGVGGYRRSLATDDRAAVEKVWSAYPQVREHDPLPGGPAAGVDRIVSPIGRATRFSELIALRAFRRLDLHAEVCRPLGVDYVMKLFLPADAGERSAFVFDRQGHDFTERDRLVLDVLFPHLVQLRKRARIRSSIPDGQAERTPREREIMAWVARGKRNAEIAQILWVAPGTVRKHLDNVYAKLGVSNRTEAVARARGWVSDAAS